MKKILLQSVLLCALLIACTDSRDSLDNDLSLYSVSNKIEEIESILPKGETKIETEGIKIIGARSEKKINEIKEKLQNAYYKQQSYLRSNDGEGEVGVLQSEAGKCGSFKEILIFMDCEDSGNGASTLSGWTGTSYIDRNKNADLFICAVKTSQFKFNRGYEEYAVLLLGGQRPNGISTITRYFDNENTDNANYRGTAVNGVPFAGYYGACEIGKANTTLVFLHYLSTSTPSSFPNLGFSYGVFGQLGSNRGYLQTDDEDQSPSSTCMVDRFNGQSYTTSYVNNGAVGSILNVDIDRTRMYMSKIQ